jgi:hypothetical protein
MAARGGGADHAAAATGPRALAERKRSRIGRPAASAAARLPSPDLIGGPSRASSGRPRALVTISWKRRGWMATGSWPYPALPKAFDIPSWRVPAHFR